MKPFAFLLGLACCATAQEFGVLERGVDHRVIRSVREEINDQGKRFSVTNRYVEVCSSMHYLEGDTWHDTVAAFKITSEVGAGDRSSACSGRLRDRVLGRRVSLL